jgi:hypothetical protein
MRNYQPFDLIEELQGRGLFQPTGHRQTAPTSAWQSCEDYIASFHSRSSLARSRMRPADVAAFDSQLRDVVTPYCNNGMIELQTIADVVWGVPQRGR